MPASRKLPIGYDSMGRGGQPETWMLRCRSFHLAGTPIVKASLTSMAERELAKLLPLSWALIMGILYLFFRNLDFE